MTKLFEGKMPSSDGSEQWMAAALSPDGLIHTVSTSAEQLTGYSSDELVDRPLSCIVAEPNSISEMLQTARDWGVWCGEIRHRDRSGKEWEARATVTLLTGRPQE